MRSGDSGYLKSKFEIAYMNLLHKQRHLHLSFERKQGGMEQGEPEEEMVAQLWYNN